MNISKESCIKAYNTMYNLYENFGGTFNDRSNLDRFKALIDKHWHAIKHPNSYITNKELCYRSCEELNSSICNDKESIQQFFALINLHYGQDALHKNILTDDERNNLKEKLCAFVDAIPEYAEVNNLCLIHEYGSNNASLNLNFGVDKSNKELVERFHDDVHGNLDLDIDFMS